MGRINGGPQNWAESIVGHKIGPEILLSSPRNSTGITVALYLLTALLRLPQFSRGCLVVEKMQENICEYKLKEGEARCISYRRNACKLQASRQEELSVMCEGC